MTTLITNGTVVAPSGAVDMDVLIDGEQHRGARAARVERARQRSRGQQRNA